MTPRKKTTDESAAAKATTAAKKPATKRAPKKSAEETPVTTAAAVDMAGPDPEIETAARIGSAEPAEVMTPETVEESSAAPVQVWVDKMVAFFIGGQRYGLPIESVQEIQQIVAFSEVPSQGGAVTGMVNLRGAVIPAVDMRILLGMSPLDYTLETPMIICRRRSRLIALIVEEVQDVIELPDGCLQAAPAMHALSDKMIGVCRLDSDLVYLLDVDRLLAPLDGMG